MSHPSESCLQHVVADDGKNCRNCYTSAAWLAEGNRWRGSSYEMPGANPRYTRWALFPRPIKHVYLWGNRPSAGSNDWIEVVW
jgi:hypothetical protein